MQAAPFQKHLLHFATPTARPLITITSGTKGALSLGLNFPVSVFLSLALRIMYSPFPFLKPVDVLAIPESDHRTQLEDIPLARDTYSRSDLLLMFRRKQDGLRQAGVNQSDGFLASFIKVRLDAGHIIGFWNMAADAKTGFVARDDVQAFQNGSWQDGVVQRRRGKEDVLPFFRGGPISVNGHSWAVGKFLGVKVYVDKKQ